MTTPPPAPSSPGMEAPKIPSYLHAVFVFAAAASVWIVNHFFGSLAGLVTGVLAVALSLHTNYRASLYPQIYLGRSFLLFGFLASFMGFSQTLGDAAYHRLWQRSFMLEGDFAVFEGVRGGWTVEVPWAWTNYVLNAPESETYFFSPPRQTPTVQFSLTRRQGAGEQSLENAVETFLALLPKGKEIAVLERRRIPYPQGREAFELIYQDPFKAVVLRHRLFFLDRGEDLYVLSVAAVPSWMERLKPEADRFLFSFRPKVKL